LASGTIRLKTAGVGREELLQKLTGAGEVHLTNLELRGWDVNASVADGIIRYREDVVDGLEKAPEAFIGMLDGHNFGKAIVRVGA